MRTMRTKRIAKGTFGTPSGVVNTNPTYVAGFSRPETAAEIKARAAGIEMTKVKVMKVEVAGKDPVFKTVEL